MKKHPLAIYLILSFGMAWIIWILSAAFNLIGTIYYQALSVLAMWMPATAYFITKKLCPDIELCAKIKPVFKKKDIKFYVMAWLTPALVTILGAVLYYCIFSDELDLSMPYLRQLTQSTGQKTPDVPVIAATQFMSAITIAPLINSIFAMGEEIGWRGYLYPTLKKRFSPIKAHLLIGLIWGIWHTPINMTGYNYGLKYPFFPWLGIIAMSVLCFSIGILLSFITEKTGSIFWAAIMHGATNAVIAIGLCFQSVSEVNGKHTILGPATNGLLGGLPLLLIAILVLVFQNINKQEKN